MREYVFDGITTGCLFISVVSGGFAFRLWNNDTLLEDLAAEAQHVNRKFPVLNMYQCEVILRAVPKVSNISKIKSEVMSHHGLSLRLQALHTPKELKTFQYRHNLS